MHIFKDSFISLLHELNKSKSPRTALTFLYGQFIVWQKQTITVFFISQKSKTMIVAIIVQSLFYKKASFNALFLLDMGTGTLLPKSLYLSRPTSGM